MKRTGIRTIAIRVILPVLLVLSTMLSAAAAPAFSDVGQKHWAYNNIYWANSNGLMKGTSATEFSPSGSLTRGMFVTILYRLSEKRNYDISCTKSVGFSDVPVNGNAWYTEAVLWSAEKGIVNGLGDGTFGVSTPISREQMATVSCRFLTNYLEQELTAAKDTLSYPDAGDVSDWAKESLIIFSELGIIKGDGAGYFRPKDASDRASAATVFKNLWDYLDKYEEEHATAHRHNYETVIVTEPNCTTEGLKRFTCKDCGDTYDEVVEPLGHVEVEKTGLITATRIHAGSSSGTYCSRCYEELQSSTVLPATSFSYSDVSIYVGHYGYDSLCTEANAEKLCEFYRMLDEMTVAFHDNPEGTTTQYKIKDDTYYLYGTINFASLGLTQSDAFAAWISYLYDHPLYYWMDHTIFTNGAKTAVSFCVRPEYADGTVRVETNQNVYEAIEQSVSGILGETKNYEIALWFHDDILDDCIYARDESGYAESDLWAHSIDGPLFHDAAVCEGYSRLYQLYLNLAEVDNIYVVGVANGPHAWNLVQMDDGGYYNVDLTWDQIENNDNELIHNYFCVSAGEDITKLDYYYVLTGCTDFYSTHTVTFNGIESGLSYTYNAAVFPTVSQSVYVSPDGSALLRDSFTVDGLTYVVCGHNQVALASSSGETTMTVPETVRYHGTTYTVSSVASYKDGYRVARGLFSGKTKSVILPKTVTDFGDGIFSVASGGNRIERIFYTGNESDWENIEKGSNSYLDVVLVLFYSDTPVTGCWHYVDGVPTPYKAS